MARRERERFTERNRPTRRPGDDGDDDIVIREPAKGSGVGVLVGGALGGLLGASPDFDLV